MKDKPLYFYRLFKVTPEMECFFESDLFYSREEATTQGTSDASAQPFMCECIVYDFDEYIDELLKKQPKF